MKIIKLLATSLLVALSLGVSSCGDDNELPSSPPLVQVNPIDELFAEYMENYSNIKFRFCSQKECSVFLTGMKDNHLWFSEYDAVSKQLKFEWTDTEETDTILNVHEGYGEYVTVKLRYFYPQFYKKTSIGDIVTLKLNNLAQTIFTFNKQSKRTELQSGNQKNFVATNWYAESVFIGKHCYSHKGEIIYEAKVTPDYYALPISYEEGIELKDRHISKYNYKESKTVWETYIEFPFNITPDAKFNYTLLDNSTNVWQYKCEVIFYDGNKKDFTFKINIDNGTLLSTKNGQV